MMGLQLFGEVILRPSFSITREIIGSLFIHIGMLGMMVVGLRLENVSVPPSGILGGSVTLGCDYVLEYSDTLLSLKWYRNGHEFFRYFPGNTDQPISTFSMPGVFVDLGESLKIQQNKIRFRLKNLDYNSGGLYRCEISADAPTFRTLFDEGNFSIVVLPENPQPILSGFPSSVAQWGHKVNGNCTFANSFPAADISVYLNNVTIHNSSEIELMHYEPEKVGQSQRLTSNLGIKFRLAPKLFQFGLLQIRCEAKLFDQRWEVLKNITHQLPFHTSGQNPYSSSSSSSFSSSFRLDCWGVLATIKLATATLLLSF